jgi:hypothetical protein
MTSQWQAKSPAEMSPIFLLSWRVIAEIAMSENSEWLVWLDASQRSSRLVISQFSLIRASSYIQRSLGKNCIHPQGLLERFVRQHLQSHTVIDARHISAPLYNELAAKIGKDDLELFALSLALRNSYTYLCWDNNELTQAVQIASGLLADTFHCRLNAFQPS